MLNSGDTLLDRTYPARASQILDKDPQIDFVHADLIFEDRLIGPYIMRPLRTKNVLSPNIGRGMPYRHQSMVVRKEVYDRVGFFNLNYICSDFDWIYAICHKSFFQKICSFLSHIFIANT